MAIGSIARNSHSLARRSACGAPAIPYCECRSHTIPRLGYPPLKFKRREEVRRTLIRVLHTGLIAEASLLGDAPHSPTGSPERRRLWAKGIPGAQSKWPGCSASNPDLRRVEPGRVAKQHGPSTAATLIFALPVRREARSEYSPWGAFCQASNFSPIRLPA